jgi:hypothetical protein
MGKDFSITPDGDFKTHIHVNRFVAAPFLELVVNGKSLDLAGEWVSFRELKQTAGFSYDFFYNQCEEIMRRAADAYPDLFESLVHIIGGQQVEDHLGADIAVVLQPLPKVPVMLCYWSPDDGLDSKLTLLFDRTMEDNLPNRGIFTICIGLARMIERTSARHGAFTVVR